MAHGCCKRKQDRLGRHWILSALSVAALCTSALAANQAPELTSGPVCTPPTTVVGAPVLCEAIATDGDGDDLLYDWDFGDGTVEEDGSALVVHSWLFPGIFTVTVTVKDGNGGSDTDTATVTVLPVPVLGNRFPYFTELPSGSPNPVETNTDVLFSAAATDPDGDDLTYAWDFGDGGSGSGSSVTHQFATAGSFLVTLMISDGKGGLIFGLVDIIVSPVPVTNHTPVALAEPVAAPNPALEGEDITFTMTAVDPDDDLLTYTWDFGDGNQAVGGTVNHAYAQSGTYQATVTVSDALLSVTREVAVRVSEPLGVEKFQTKVFFMKTGSDKAMAKGFIDLPLGTTTLGANVVVDLAGSAVSFVLDGKGKGVSGLHKMKLKIKKSFAGGAVPFKVQFKGALWDSWKDEGMDNTTVDGAQLTLNTELIFNNVSYFAVAPVVYKAKADKTGKGKLK